jgi:hypothetical protein
MGTRGLCSGCKEKLELADESVVNGTLPGHIYTTFSLPPQCNNLFAQVHRDFFLVLYKNI